MSMTDTTTPLQPPSLILVTGPSGAGRSTSINVLEDLGFEVIDNLPLSLVPRLLDGPAMEQPLALGIDARNRDFSAESLVSLITQLDADPRYNTEVLYIDASVDVLIRRFSETRRRHPLSPAESPRDGIARELDLLTPVRNAASILIDTSDMTVHDLKGQLTHLFAPGGVQKLALSLHSFSYKRGIPRGIDMVFDCRFLRNPYWEEGLRGLNGTDGEVADYVMDDPRFKSFFGHIRSLTEMLLPAYIEEGKSHLSIGFGCTGGQHRSVTLTEILAKSLAENNWQVSKRHRELERRSPSMDRPILGK